jgi:predicted NBD/HSP70 family sugar kinase
MGRAELTHPTGSSRLLRALNESAALAHLLGRGPLTRPQLRELTGLSKPTVSEAVRRLGEAGLVRVVGHVSGGPGPNAEVYAVNPDTAFAVAVSVRQTPTPQVPSVAAAIADATGAVREQVELAVDFGGTDPVGTVAGVVRRLAATVGRDRVEVVQLGVAGAVDPRAGTVHHVDLPGWDRPGLLAALRERLGTRVDLDNDVNLATVAERRRGVATAAENFVLLWCGDGLGLGIDLGGTLLRGTRGGAGEIGYLPLYGPDARPAGELQELVGGPAVIELAARFGVRAGTAGEAVRASGPEFLAALAERMVLMLATVAAVLDPELVVLAGEVAQAGGAPLRDAVAQVLRSSTRLDTDVQLSAITGDPVLLGALDAADATLREQLLASLRD